MLPFDCDSSVLILNNLMVSEPKNFEDFDGDEDVIDLRAYEIVGGIVYLNLLNMPPQPKVANTWTITQRKLLGRSMYT